MATLLPSEALAAQPGDRSGVPLPGLQQDLEAKLDQVEAAKLEGWAGNPVQPPAEYEPTKVAPPAGGTADVALTAAAGNALVPVGTLPVSIGKASPTASDPTPPAPSGTWSVAVEARAATEAAGVDGALIKVTPPAEGSTPVDVELDYEKFEDLYGTEWATRLELTQLPECFLTTPELPECTVGKEVPSTNDPNAGTVRATIDPATASVQGMSTMSGGGPVVLAASDGASGAGGTYKATPLSASGNWSAGGSAGGFSWTYPLSVPAPPAGPAPKIAFSYSSQSVDDKTSATNGQASWLGDGWDYHPGFVERRYRSCSDDRKDSGGTPNNTGTADKKKSDLCWAGDNVVLSLGGGTTELVRDSATGKWVSASDSGARVERKTDAAAANGAKDGEYWVVTTRDGTKYHFGRHDVDGAGTRAVTDSVLTVPVFGNHPGEPCYQSAYANSSCTQAWRWNLDYVEDVHGNAMVVDWARETNHYAKNGKFKEKVSYHRGGYPKSISYGLRSTDLSGAPSAKVEFGVDERCVKEGGSACSDTEFESKNYQQKQPWWDTPSTLHCKASETNCYVSAPTFWSRKRLTSVTTYGQRTPGSTALSLVDRWTLAQSFPKQRTDTHPPLWLESVTRTGYGTGKDANGNQLSQSLPPVSFLANVQDMPNRVAKSATDATPDFDRLRVETIRTETGGELQVDYSDPCPVGATHPKPEENTTRCHPVHWSPDSELETPPLEWFNKYVVDKVTEKDRVSRQPDTVTAYTYEGGAAWAKNDDEFTKPELRTYSEWRGYASVVTRKGATAAMGSSATEQSETRTRYFRGMSGDAGRAQITVKDSTGTETLGEDIPQYQGQAAETITYTRAGGGVATRELAWPWSQKTASRPREGNTPLEAHRTGASRTDKIESISDGRTRVLRTRTTVDTTYGLPLTVHTEALTPNGSGGWTSSEQTCTSTDYVHNTGAHLIGLPQRTRTTSGDCTQTATGAVVADTRTSYDALAAFGTAPVKGLVRQVDTANGAGTGWITTTRSEYDALGRQSKSIDAAGNETTIAFSPATGPAFTVTTTNPLGHASTVKTDPARGVVLEAGDPNNRKITNGYDELGRSTAVWTTSQNPATDKAAYAFEYRLSEHEPPAVTSRVLRDNGTYEDTITLYDGLLRPRQTQAEALGGGRLVTDTFHDANGTVRRVNNAYHAEGEPTKEIFVPETVFHLPNSTETRYDGLGRPTRVTTLFEDTPQHSTTVRHEGDWTLTRTSMSADGVTPLKGSRAAKTWTDALGRPSLHQQYTATDLTTWTNTAYGYDVRGNLSKVTDPNSNDWTYTYDVRGRLTASNDPDSGSSAYGYNDLDLPVWSEDASRRKTYTAYDKLGRRTSTVEDDPAGSPLATWTYDTLPGAKGHPVAATRHTGSLAVTTEVTGYDAEYRPTGNKLTVPDTAATKGLAGTYAYGTTYTPTGLPESASLPATPGGLAAERLVTRYDGEGAPLTLSGLTWYTADAVYGPHGQLLRSTTGAAPLRLWTTNFYDRNTGRVTQSLTDRETPGDYRVSGLSYSYDVAGNPTSVTETRPGGWTDRQCFAYDAKGQLTEAWTGSTAACAGPSLADVTAGPDGDGYWQSFRFDAIGNRTKLVEHDLTNAALDDETVYTYGVQSGGGALPPVTTQPHTLATSQKTTRTANSTVSASSSFAYDPQGNTTRRTIGGDTQTLNWDRRNKLTSATSPGIGAVAVTGLNGKCLDVEGGRSADGTPVQIYTCNETKAQQWRLTGDTVRALGKCLTNDNGNARLSACDGSAKQKFTYRPGDKSLYNAAANACLDISGWNTTDGADLLLYQCNGQGNQQWAFNDTTTYIYDAAGNRLIEETGSARTLYLGEAEVTVDKAGQAVDAQRYYSFPGAPATVRRTYGKATGHNLSVLVTDHHNTATAAVEQATGQGVHRRKSDVFGNPRGAQPSWWPGSRTFLGTGVEDQSTSLTHIGAREYDATTGRFLSVDPIMDLADPQQMNGYTYANGNPVSGSDPDGLKPIITADGNDAAYLKANDAWWSGGPGGWTFNDRDTKVTTKGSNRTTVTIVNSYGGRKAGSSVTVKEEHRTCLRGEGCRWKPGKMRQLTSDEIHFSLDVAGFIPGLGAAGDVVNGVVYAFEGNWKEAGWSLVALVPLAGDAVAAKRKGGKLWNWLTHKAPTECLVPNSFVAGTKVLMADGTSKPIEDVETGEKVLATNPETGETEAKTVASVIYTADDKSYVDVTVETAEGSAEISTTAEHLFWSESARAWLNARDLAPGMTLRTDTGHAVTVTAVRDYQATERTYNLTISDLHTYYVLAGGTPVLVHNDGGAPPGVWTIDPKRSTKIMNGGPFRANYYQQPPDAKGDSLWWSPDKAGHNSSWKVFRETSKGLEWIADAGPDGTFITDKHKSEKGKFVSWKNLKVVC